MNQRLISEIGKSSRLGIINRLKRTHGLSVGELSRLLDMSYMGVKQHCIELEREGYLDTWRRPKPVGRPEMLYRLTQRARDLFPVASNAVTIELLEAAKKLFGPAAPEKLLFTIFQKKTEGYAAKVKGATLAERARSLARLRDEEGCMADFEDAPAVGGDGDHAEAAGALRIVEHHSPISDMLRCFPIVARLEREMFERTLRAPVRREESCASGLYRCVFHIGAPPAAAGGGAFATGGEVA